METLVIDRSTTIETLFSFVGAPRIKAEKEAGRTLLTPIVDPADYANDTDYLNAIPGFMDKIDARIAADKWEDFPEGWIIRDV